MQPKVEEHSPSSAELPVYVTVDIGPALATLGRGHQTDADWEPTFAALALLRNAVEGLEQQFGESVPVTWFLRADQLILRQFGSQTAVVQRFLEVVPPAFLRGHELGWMPQLPGSAGTGMAHDLLEGTHERVLALLGSVDSVRMGDCYHDNLAMRILDTLGVRFDCSAVPGRRKSDPGWYVDWRGTPETPYHPACDDYRRAGDPHWRILEVPMTVIPMQASYDPQPLLRYVNPCFPEHFLWPALQGKIARAPYLMCVLHPDELLPGMAEGHPMVSYSPDVFSRNLTRLHEQARAAGRRPRFLRLRDHVTA